MGRSAGNVAVTPNWFQAYWFVAGTVTDASVGSAAVAGSLTVRNRADADCPGCSPPPGAAVKSNRMRMPVTLAQSPAKEPAGVHAFASHVGSVGQAEAPDPTQSSPSVLTSHWEVVPVGRPSTCTPKLWSRMGRHVEPRAAPVASIRSPATGRGSTNVSVRTSSVPLLTVRSFHSSVAPMTVLAAHGETKNPSASGTQSRSGLLTLTAPLTMVPSTSPRTPLNATMDAPARGCTKLLLPHWFDASPPRVPWPLPDWLVQVPSVWSVVTTNWLVLVGAAPG